jgi:hypothetical protein
MSHLSEEQLDQIIDEERSRNQAPLNEWRTIAARARDEGLIRERDSSRAWAGATSQPWLQAAAAVLLLIGGIAIGRTTIGLPGDARTAASAPEASNLSTTTGSSAQPVASRVNASFASVNDASDALKRAAGEYQRASEFIAANNASAGGRDSVAIYSARAAALDQIVNATENALQTAPHDPVINQYYLATMGARVATQQFVARPVGLRGF